MRRALAAGLVVFIAGIVRDLQWHATHDTQQEFETASKQAEVHWLLWLGVLVLVVVSWLGLRRSGPGRRDRAYLLMFASGVAYAAVSVWHFIEHANGTDPELAHALLYVTSLGIVVGTALVLWAMRGGQARQPTRAVRDDEPVSNQVGRRGWRT
jgi:hypothetical protein